jgi:hypothetical protein
VILVFVHPAADFAAHKRTRLIEVNFVTCINKVDGGG